MYAPGAIQVGPSARRLARVVPPASSPASGVDRDAGISVRLRSGAVLWLFGDTAAHHPDGSLRYFVIGTGALADPADPATTIDVLGADGVPAALAVPTADFVACDADARPGMWPAAAVLDARGPFDRVVVWLENICLEVGGRVTDRGMAVAEWIDDPEASLDRPIQLRILALRVSAGCDGGE